MFQILNAQRAEFQRIELSIELMESVVNHRFPFANERGQLVLLRCGCRWWCCEHAWEGPRLVVR